MPYGLPWSEQFIEQLSEKELRDEFVADQVRSRIALMIRALREQRDLTQTGLGDLMDKPQSVVSRIEDPDYGKASLQTLLDVAAAFNLPLIVDIPEWDDWFRRMRGVSKAELRRESFNSEKLASRARAAREAVSSGSIQLLRVDGEEFATTSSNGGAQINAAGYRRVSVGS